MWHDLQQAVRALRTHPGFVALAAFVLALGIGLNTTIFSIVYAMLFRPLPVDQPDELVAIYVVTNRQPDRPFVLHPDSAEFYAKHNEALVDVAMHWGITLPMRADAEIDRVRLEWVTSNYFSVLGVAPMLGRTLIAAEDSIANPDRAMVISHALWSRRFKSDPAIVGRQISISPHNEPDLTFTIVGVMHPGFKGVAEPWTPTQAWITFAQAHGPDRARRSYGGAAIGRVKPGVSFAQARAAIEAQSREAFEGVFAPATIPRAAVFATNEVRTPNDPSAAAVPVRLAAAMTIVVALVLLVAATNIAGVLMARGAGRSGEIAIRRVLGAGPLRLVRQLLAESVLLAATGSALGLLLAWWLLAVFRSVTPMQYALDVAVERPVVLFTLGICLLAGVVVGLTPAWQATRLDILPWLAAGAATQTNQVRGRLRHAITLPQVAISLVLLLVGGVYVRALLKFELANKGYQHENLVVASPMLRLQVGERTATRAGLTDEQYAERSRRFYQRLLDGLRAMPGTQDVAIASGLPLREPSERPNWSAVSQDAFLAGEREGPPTERASVSPGYFRAMGIPLVAGRDFDERDTRASRPVAVVSRALAQRLWPGRDPVGQSFTILDAWAANNKQLAWYDVVGVVGDVTPVLYDRSLRPFLYLPLGQEWRPTSSYVIARGPGDSRTLLPALKGAIAGADPFADARTLRTMTQMVDEILYPRRIAATILAASGAIALFLATIGIYGVVSYSLAQRTGEIGVRVALGAERRDIIRLILREGIMIATVGSIAGLVLGYPAIRITSSRYLALPSVDLASLILTPLVLAAVVLLSCYLPARRAGCVDAMEALRRM